VTTLNDILAARLARERPTLFAGLINAWARFKAQRDQRRAALLLSRCSDWELKDIGLTRSQIAAAVAGRPLA